MKIEFTEDEVFTYSAKNLLVDVHDPKANYCLRNLTCHPPYNISSSLYGKGL